MNVISFAQCRQLASALFALGAFGFHGGLHAATHTAQATASVRIVKFTPKLTQKAVLARPDTDLVEFSDGRRMRVGELRRLAKWGDKVRHTSSRPFPAALRAKPATTGQAVADARALAQALKQPDNTTLRLPSGRLATVGQIKFVLPKVEESVGHALTAAPSRPNLSGPAIKVTAKSDWRNILGRPDRTVLEAPDGQRVTVGEVKRVLESTKRATGTRTKAGASARTMRSPATKQR